MVPPASPASTTGIRPAGAGRAASICTARRAAAAPISSGLSRSSNSKPLWLPTAS